MLGLQFNYQLNQCVVFVAWFLRVFFATISALITGMIFPDLIKRLNELHPKSPMRDDVRSVEVIVGALCGSQFNGEREKMHGVGSLNCKAPSAVQYQTGVYVRLSAGPVPNCKVGKEFANT